ncbi:DUF3857 domain-containing protein [Alteriqipengyuania flavescens]|uniref:DUF3857 domain-containing protein n=1 Tax=Alteriqipengyuania flavescens TaxID=3053610 RepID=UPI0025B57113|nr:DUF3857 domain-containing protein [Alteriqipengyuania flavescens]WJY18039.1 DUF3857 domain-containing protein [Alteriqipengyuania flavescens]WJY23980.1 DUF3857 domain-containing protein [Alteriqipengyuania flavescens]
MSRTKFAAFGLIAAAWVSPALAGDEPIYAPAPDWVEVIPASEVDSDTGPSDRLIDTQIWIDEGTVHRYEERIVRLDSTEALTSAGTLQTTWLPDKGDLTIHALQILRGGEVIDLIEQGVRFDTLRRERGLEMRFLDGVLTATVAVPGLKVGDRLRVAYSTSLNDQALGNEIQARHFLPSEPQQIGRSRVIASWAADDDILWSAGPDVEGIETETVGGRTRLSLELPIARRKPVPYDAPSRFKRPPILEITSFANWQELSREMAPHFETAATIEPGGELAGKVAAIRAASTDLLTRAVAATRLVQEDISYLMNGLDGGNYLPQNAELTWDKKYGDCKAKSVLLLSMLRELGIESQAVLVTTQGGDALSEVTALPGHFDHMIVRATIDGVDYWIDGTSNGTRATNIGEVPPFYYALPLTAEGTDLVPMTQREQPWPDQIMTTVLDLSAGIDLPGLSTMRIQAFGAGGASFKQFAAQLDAQGKQEMLRSMSGSGDIVTDVDVSYDDESGTGLFVAKGLMDNPFSWRDGELVYNLTPSSGLSFSPDRARSSWRNIPAATRGPTRERSILELELPGAGKGFTLRGDAAMRGEAANQVISWDGAIEGSTVSVAVETIGHLGEIAPDRIGAEKRAVMALSAKKLEVLAPADPLWRWERDPRELARAAAPLMAQFDAALANAAPDDFAPLERRAAFKKLLLDYEAALIDYDRLVEERGAIDELRTRASLHDQMGNLAKATEGYREVYDLEPDVWNGYNLAIALARTGAIDEALETLDTIVVDDDDAWRIATFRSDILGIAGRAEDGLFEIESALASGETDAALLNQDCWFRGIYDVGTEDGVARCNAAVEKASESANVFDSRAMMHFKLGDHDAALADLDAALELDPSQEASLYLRGVVRLAEGDAAGMDDIRAARRIWPAVDTIYAGYGITPPS